MAKDTIPPEIRARVLRETAVYLRHDPDATDWQPESADEVEIDEEKFGADISALVDSGVKAAKDLPAGERPAALKKYLKEHLTRECLRVAQRAANDAAPDETDSGGGVLADLLDSLAAQQEGRAAYLATNGHAAEVRS